MNTTKEKNVKDIVKNKFEIKQIINFFIEDEEYGLPIGDIEEIIRLPKLTKLPKTPIFIKGIINLRGRVVPVVDLRERFEVEGKEINSLSRAIIVNINGKLIGLIVDKVAKVLNVEDSDFSELPAMTDYSGKEYVKAVVNIDERIIVILDTKKLLSYQEIDALDDVQEDKSK